MTPRRSNGFALRLAVTVLLAALGVVGCKAPFPCGQRPMVSSELSSRLGHGLGRGGGLQQGSIPDAINVDDGLTADECVALALWNNSAYHELLAQLGVSRAQLYDAGLIADPQLVLFFPLGPKQLEFTTFQAVDSIWLRPIRRRAAQLDLCELAQQMVQNGLNAARDARVAHANLLLAQQRAELTTEAQGILENIADLAGKRLDAGDISELEATTSRIEALRSEATAASATQDILLAQEQLRTLIGVPLDQSQILAVEGQFEGPPSEDKETLVAMAFAMRPDLRAIELRKTAACERAQLARKQFMLFDLGYDANAEGMEGYESGPATRLTIPIFNGNKGRIAIANALVRQVDRQYVAAQDRIELEVRSAMTQLEQALEQRELVEQRILPALAEAGELARRNYEDGGVPYFLVLQTTGQFVDAQLRRMEAAASVRRAYSELERSVGQKLAASETEPSRFNEGASPSLELQAPPLPFDS